MGVINLKGLAVSKIPTLKGLSYNEPVTLFIALARWCYYSKVLLKQFD